ncbi:hypothetical protein Q9L41_17970 [Vibrio cholerae]|nr:hypothetical protein [Vibrio cholerae]MDP4497685.1 hypothetical protein [Vibrio cholerae]WLP78784.1 hypothetical protein Q9L40_01935 [Vibrio cholerae]
MNYCKYLKFTLVLVTVITSLSANSAILGNAKVKHLYVQSLNGEHKSDAHAVSLEQSIDPSCQERLYINPLDKELLSALLAYKAAGTSFNLMYETGKPKQLIA